MTHTQSLALLGLFFAACGDKGKDDDTGMMSIDDPNDYADSSCEVVEETPLEMDSVTESGVSVASMVATLEGEHAATLTWADGTTTGLLVTITDIANPRFQDFEVVSSSGSGPLIEIACGDQVVVDIQLSVVSEDGHLNERLAHTATESDGAMTPGISLDLTETTGTFNVLDWTDEPYDRAWADLSATWGEAGIAGSIDGMGETSSGSGDEGFVMVSRIDVATFVAVSE